MSDISVWSFDRNDLFSSVGFDEKDSKILEGKVDDLIQAVLNSYTLYTVERNEGQEDAVSSSAPLYIPGLRYHLNLSNTTKQSLIYAIGFIADAYILHTLKLLDLIVILSTANIQNLIQQLTRLTDQQIIILRAICDLKRKRGSPLYNPTTRQIANKLGLSQKEIEDALSPIKEKVVKYEPERKTWIIKL